MWDSFQTSAIIAKNLFFICFWNPNCVRKNVPVYMSMYAGHDSRTQGKSYFGHLIFQKYICAHLKCYIFHFNTPQINFISNWALNWPWALEFEHHWGMGARIVRGTKCSVYNTGWSEKGCGRAKLSSQTSLIIKSAIIKNRPLSRNSIKKKLHITNDLYYFNVCLRMKHWRLHFKVRVVTRPPWLGKKIIIIYKI